MNYFNTIIIGGGASGCLAAIKLKEMGVDAIILESGDRILKKLLVTGNGRCNITNNKLTGDVKKYYSSKSRINYNPVLKYDYEKTLDYLSKLGLLYVELEEGKIYPRSLQASSVVDLLRLRLEELEIDVFENEKIHTIKKDKTQYKVYSSSYEYSCDNLIIATGGLAMPNTGSDGSMNKIFKDLGLEVIKPLPALVQLKLDAKFLKSISGVKFEGSASLSFSSERITESGELLFTDYGISGPPILQLSRFSATPLSNNEDVRLYLDMFKDMSKDKVIDLIYDRVEKYKDREAQYLLGGIVNKKLIPLILKSSGLEKISVKISEIDHITLMNIVDMLKKWEFKVIGDNGFKNAQSTIGGLSMKEVIEDTLEVKRYKNMYVIGEALDVCGACGGYNLQWAWSSALCAADSIILKEKNKDV